MKEIASILHLALSSSKPGVTKEGKPAKGKVVVDDAAREEAAARAKALLNDFVLYPELDLDFLKAEFALKD